MSSPYREARRAKAFVAEAFRYDNAEPDDTQTGYELAIEAESEIIRDDPDELAEAILYADASTRSRLFTLVRRHHDHDLQIAVDTIAAQYAPHRLRWRAEP